jgi:hypothetical protein
MKANEYYTNCYLQGYEAGHKQRNYLLREGLPLENFENNQYQGDTFHGLYGYMDAMRGLSPRYENVSN